jgi:hypothetical protein
MAAKALRRKHWRKPALGVLDLSAVWKAVLYESWPAPYSVRAGREVSRPCRP